MKKSKNAAATMIRAGCLLLDQAYRDKEKRMSAKIPLPISSRSVGSVGDADIFFAFLLAIPTSQGRGYASRSANLSAHLSHTLGW